MDELHSQEKLKELVEKRQKRCRVKGGEVFAMWGVLNLIAFFLYNWAIHSDLIWLVLIVTGGIIQTIYIGFFLNNKEYKLLWAGNIGYFWLFQVLMLPLIFNIFPFVLKLYSPAAIFPLVCFWLALGMFVSGHLIEQWSIRTGSFVFFISGILLCLFLDKIMIIDPIAITFGLIVPGIWSKYEERKPE